jgi:hypothetical protein
MIVHDVRQGSPEWLAVRCGIPTASKFGVLMSKEARTGKLTDGARTYRNHLLAEWVIGRSLDDGMGGGFLARGTQLEPEAIARYEWEREITVERSGFITLDDGSAGCSLDGLAGEDGIVEAKNYALVHHIDALLQTDREHYPQIMGGLWISGRQWCDRIYHSPVLPQVVLRFERDGEYIAKLAEAVGYFNGHLAEGKAELVRLGCKPKDHER